MKIKNEMALRGNIYCIFLLEKLIFLIKKTKICLVGGNEIEPIITPSLLHFVRQNVVAAVLFCIKHKMGAIIVACFYCVVHLLFVFIHFNKENIKKGLNEEFHNLR